MSYNLVIKNYYFRIVSSEHLACYLPLELPFYQIHVYQNVKTHRETTRNYEKTMKKIMNFFHKVISFLMCFFLVSFNTLSKLVQSYKEKNAYLSSSSKKLPIW